MDTAPKPKFTDRIRHIILTVMFQGARFVFTAIKMPIKGALVAIWDREQILVIRKSYQKGWSVPGGLLRRHETRQQAAVREAFEETGVQISEKDLVFVAQVPGDLGPRDIAHLFEVAVNGPVRIRIDGREIVEAEFVPPDKALERVINEELAAYLRTRVHG